MSKLGIKLCWHGCGSFSLRMYGQEFLFDPFFSRPEDYGPWYVANEHAPAPAEYLRGHWPDLCLITRGTYEHCDLEAVRRLGMMRPQLRFLAGDGVVRAMRRWCALPDDCVWPTEVGDVHHLGSVQVETLAGVQPPAGDRPDGAAAEPPEGARPFGLLPAPGPPLGYRLVAHEDRVYVSGDTTLAGVPHLDATVAVLCVGGPVRHPLTGEPSPSMLGEADVAAAARRLSARVVIPIHWDFRGLAEPFDVEGLIRRVADEMPSLSVLVPPYNEWVEVEA